MQQMQHEQQLQLSMQNMIVEIQHQIIALLELNILSLDGILKVMEVEHDMLLEIHLRI